MMKKKFALLCALGLLLLAAGGLADDARTITVTGSATILMDADSARVSLGVVSVAKEAGEASRQNAEQVERLIAALEEAGIPRKDISTAYYFVNTRRNYSQMTEDGDYPVIGYEVNNTLTVIVRDLDKAGSIIDVGLANGANNCDGISFSTSKAGEARDQALAAAITEGRRRAEIMATACNGELGDILSVQENASYGSAVISNKRSDMGVETEEVAAAGTTILSDGLSFSATVEITFALQ